MSDLYEKVYSAERSDAPRTVRVEREFLCSACETFTGHKVDAEGDTVVQTCTACGKVTRWLPVSALGALSPDMTDYDALVVALGVEAIAEMLVRRAK